MQNRHENVKLTVLLRCGGPPLRVYWASPGSLSCSSVGTIDPGFLASVRGFPGEVEVRAGPGKPGMHRFSQLCRVLGR